MLGEQLQALIIKVLVILTVVGVLFYLLKYHHLRTDELFVGHTNTTTTMVLQRQMQVSPTETIFVSIPSYKDSQLIHTILHLYSQSYAPYRVFVGVCLQTTEDQKEDAFFRELVAAANQPKETAFATDYQGFFQTHVRVQWVDAVRACGPVVARAAIERRLYGGEKYFAMVDSHMRFAKYWDSKAVNDLHDCKSDKPILTMWPGNYEDIHSLGHFEELESMPPTCSQVTGVDDNKLPLVAGALYGTVPAKPALQLFWTPCFSFTFAAAHIQVPYDLHCRNLFEGEQISMSARFWTHGWDFYAPKSMLCLHKYDRSYRRTFWELGKSCRDAVLRVCCLLGLRPLNTVPESVIRNLEQYALGSERTLTEYEEFADVRLGTSLVGKRAQAGAAPNEDNADMLAKYGRLPYARRRGG